MAKHVASLNDRFDLSRSNILLSGAQAIVRLVLMQKQADKASGLNTAGYVSGYRGSPIAGVEGQMRNAKHLLDPADIKFHSGLNEDLAATAIWGTQQAELRGEGRFDGVFGIWYGKGPGVDRTGDVFRHANHAGTSKHGGVLALMGDDHTCESSTSAHQSEFAFLDAMMPVLNPAGVQEILDYGLVGIGLSRYAGVWVGLKCVKDNIEATAVVDAGPERVKLVEPKDFTPPPGGLNIRLNDSALAKEARLHDYKRDAILAYARANKIDKLIFRGKLADKAQPKIKLGIVTAGKSYLDTRHALNELGIDELRAAQMGIRLYKVGLVWPLEPEGINEFADGLDKIIVVEEKRSLIETQIKEQLYGEQDAPQIIGKKDEAGKILFPAKGALDPLIIAVEIGKRIKDVQDADGIDDKDLQQNLARLQKLISEEIKDGDAATRIPYFCAGCPHNSSTVVPEGSHAYAGIGCHYMVQWMDRATEGFTHMGGEGANWIGEAPFSKRPHVFQNLGDGTYDHSGSLAIRAALAAGTNITYKILYNDAVAMTGGQALDGDLTVYSIIDQMRAEGVEHVVLVSDEPDKYATGRFSAPVSTYHRNDLLDVEKELAQIPGVSVLVYDQTCASEKRRRRKRGLYPDPPKRAFINELVCEGCGDCGVQSNCVAVSPIETEFGRKRAIDQSACNKDFSCIEGFCPSFVTVHGGQLRKPAAAKPGAHIEEKIAALKEPEQVALAKPYSIVLTGVGGTGIVTISALLAQAAYSEGKGVGAIDMAGLAQKGGAVQAHMRIANTIDEISAIRAGRGGADLIIGCDLVVSASSSVLSMVREKKTRAVISNHEIMTANFTQDPDYYLPMVKLRQAFEAHAGASHVDFIDAQKYALKLLGDTIASNIFMLGYACQLGLLPVTASSLLEAIELNGVRIDFNKRAFDFGRLAAVDPAVLDEMIDGQNISKDETQSDPLQRRIDFLTEYQDARLARRYQDLVDRAGLSELRRVKYKSDLKEAVLTNYFKLLAYKDEYEVARLYTNGAFEKALRRNFEGDYKLEFHLAPPFLSPPDPETGKAEKKQFGPWMMTAFKLLAKFKGLRGTRLDIFGYSAERKMERALIAEYEEMIDAILERLNEHNHAEAVALASFPQMIAGYGHVKHANVEKAKAEKARLWEKFTALKPEPSSEQPVKQKGAA